MELPPKRLTTGELIRNFGSHSDTALAEPIVITKNGRDRLVLISIEQYNALQRAAEAHSGPRSRSRQDQVGGLTRDQHHVKVV